MFHTEIVIGSTASEKSEAALTRAVLSLADAHRLCVSAACLRLSALVNLYFHTLKRIFYPSHRDSLLYTHFFLTRVIFIPYSILTTPYFIPLPSLPLSSQLSPLRAEPREADSGRQALPPGVAVHRLTTTVAAAIQYRVAAGSGTGANSLSARSLRILHLCIVIFIPSHVSSTGALAMHTAYSCICMHALFSFPRTQGLIAVATARRGLQRKNINQQLLIHVDLDVCIQ
uniref:Uncharacterized protein n=1 Tax=Setaria viridis TaxID=4556 RepID=A0A4U6VWJ3_SETVI|nr:hypothetical protein SEVIR_2G233050v2 [Setaria viridis]